MPKTPMGAARIAALHDAHDHSRCRYGCSPENPEPSEQLNFDAGYRQASLELAAELGRADPRVEVAFIAREYLESRPNLPGQVLAELAVIALMDEDLSSAEPGPLELLRVKQANRLLEDCYLGVYSDAW